MIKLIVSDVDGTLVPDGSPDLDPEVFDIILKLREKGMQFVVASGRPWASVESAFEPVKKKIFYVVIMGRTWMPWQMPVRLYDGERESCSPHHTQSTYASGTGDGLCRRERGLSGF